MVSLRHLSPFLGDDHDDDDEPFNATAANMTIGTQEEKLVTSLLPAIVQILSALLCYYFAALACKLKMQNISFCAPLTLAVSIRHEFVMQPSLAFNITLNSSITQRTLFLIEGMDNLFNVVTLIMS